MGILRRKISLFSLLLALFSFVSLYSQELKIEGIVKDTLGNRLSDVSVVAYHEEKVVSYTFTDEAGKFILFVNKGLREIKLTVNLLGFKKMEYPINLETDTSFSVEIQLTPQVEVLNEVVLEAWEKIKVNRDTITFKVSEFSDQTESVVEDLLKNLPGVEVTQEGVIKVNGRAIDKLLVEGDDMFGSKYKMLSKNLDAKVIDQVQILNNFEDNPVLKSFQDSDKVALNLILKENKKGVWFGNAEFGLGTNSRQNHSANLGLLRKEIKFFNFLNVNNIGNRGLAQIKNTNAVELTNFNDDLLEPRSNYKPVRVDNLNDSFFKNGEDIFNNSLINTFSVLKNLNKNTKLRNVTYYAYDDIEKRNNNTTDFFLNPETISFFEQNSIGIVNNYYATQFEIRHAQQNNLFLSIDTRFENIPGRTLNRLHFNNERIDQKQSDSQINFFNKISLTKNISKNKILSVLAYYGSNDTRQSLLIQPNVFSDLFNNDPDLTIHQDSKTPQEYYGVSSEILTKGKHSQFSVKLYANQTDDDLKSDFRFNLEESLDTLSNNTRFEHTKVGLASNYQLDLTKKIFFKTSFDLHQNHLEVNSDSENFLLIDFNTGLHSKKTIFGNFGINYNFSNNLPGLELLNDNFFLFNYRFFSKGISQLQSFKNHSFTFFYTYGDYKKQFLINSFLTYSFYNNSYGFSSEVNERTNFNTRTIIGGGESTNFNLSVNRYIRAFESSLKLSTQHLWFNNQTIVNNQLGNLGNYNGNVKLQGTTYFKIPLNFKFYFLFNYSEGEFQNRTSSTNYNETFIQSVLKISNHWIMDFDARFYNFETDSFTFADFALHFNPDKNRWSFKLIGSNLLNIKRFSSVNISQFQRNESFSATIERYFMLSAKLRF